MSEELSYKQRLIQLNEWMPDIIEAVKKDLKNDHLKKDYAFFKKYFSGKNINKVESHELSDAYMRSINDEEAGNEIAEFIVHRWILKNSELYHFFEERLSKINADFTEIKELSHEQATSLEKEAVQEFGPVKTFIFSSLNGVAFSPAHLSKLEAAARQEKAKTKESKVFEEENRSLEVIKAQHAQEVARLTDKYEKKLVGFQKKYTQDVDMLKKQLANLQRKLASV